MTDTKQRNFAEAFGEHFDLAQEVALKRMRVVETLISLVSQRLSCEAEYSQRMRALSATNYSLYDGYYLSLTVLLSTLGKGIRAFQVDCGNRAEQSSIFVDNVKAEVLEPLQTLLSSQETHVKGCENKVGQLYADINVQAQKVRKSREEYVAALKDAEEVLYTCERFRRSPGEFDRTDTQTQEKLNVSMWNALRKMQDAFEAYKRHGKFTVAFRPVYDNTVSQIEKELQNDEEQRVQAAKESLQKLLIFEVSMEQNHKYDIKQISDIIEAIDVPNDVQDLIIRETSKAGLRESVFRPLQIEPEKSGWDKMIELYRQKYYGSEDQLDYSHAIEETKLHILRFDDKEYKVHASLFHAISNKLLTSLEMPEPAHVDSCRHALTGRKGRWAFVDTLRECVSAGKMKMTQEGYKVAANLMLGFLDRASQGGDTEQVAASMPVAEGLHWSDDKNKESLLFAIKSHDVWRDIGFWQKMFKESVELELLLQRSRYIKEVQDGLQPSVQLQRFARIARSE